MIPFDLDGFVYDGDWLLWAGAMDVALLEATREHWRQLCADVSKTTGGWTDVPPVWFVNQIRCLLDIGTLLR